MAQVAERVFVRDEAPPGDRVVRHAGVDRLYHWLTAAAVRARMSVRLG